MRWLRIEETAYKIFVGERVLDCTVAEIKEALKLLGPEWTWDWYTNPKEPVRAIKSRSASC